MAKNTTSSKTAKTYSFSEYLEKFKPRPLPEAPRFDPQRDRIAAEIVEKALQKIRNRSDPKTPNS